MKAVDSEAPVIGLENLLTMACIVRTNVNVEKQSFDFLQSKKAAPQSIPSLLPQLIEYNELSI